MVFEPLSFKAAIFLAVALPAVIIWRLIRRKSSASVAMPTFFIIKEKARSLRARMYRAPDFLRIAAILLLIFAFARPREGDEKVHVSSEGVAIMMLVDRSSSMEEPMIFEGAAVPRIDVVKQVFQSFVLGGDGLSGRTADLVGLSSFAGFVEHNCPLTLDHGTLTSFLEGIPTANRIEDGTAIGDALRHATLTLITGTERTNVKSRFIVLLSDGEQTAGELTPTEGAQMAASHDIKVHCIFVAGQPQQRNMRDPFSMLSREPTGEQLEQVARITGGSFSKATDGASLLEITRRLDRAEKTEISEKIVRFKERYELPLLIGMILIVLELLFRATWLLRIP